jgi:4-amino-4-deoxy-L-arabinose transferase-like glycosyltransferase
MRRALSRDVALPFFLALAVRLVLALNAPVVPDWDGYIYRDAGVEIAAGKGYTRHALDARNPSVPSAFYPVGMPAVIALVRLLGGAERSDLVLQSLAGALLVPVCYLLARRAAGRRAGRIAAYLAAFYPGSVLLSATWLAEPLVALGVATAMLPIAWSRRRHRVRALVLAGLLLGLTTYLRATSLIIAVFIAMALALTSHGIKARARSLALYGAVLVGAAIVPLVPWAIRNAYALGSPVLVSTNGGTNLLIGTLNEGGFERLPPELYCNELLLREVARDRCLNAHAVRIIRRAPLDWLARGALKVVHTFAYESAPAQIFGSSLRRVSDATRERVSLHALALTRIGWAFLLLFAVPGAQRVFRRRGVMPATLLAPILGLAVLHFVFIGGDRYHSAVAPMFVALAAIGLTRPR